MKRRLLLAIAVLPCLMLMPEAKANEWRYHGGSKNFDRYSPLSQIDKDNAGKLKILWSRPAIDASLMQKYPALSMPGYLRGTPIMVGNVLYAPNGVGLVEAFDAQTGATVWIQQPFEATMKEAAGTSTRGVDYWKSGSDARIIVTRGDYLYALHAATGGLIKGFGTDGRVQLRRQTRDSIPFSGLNGPIVVGDVIVVSGNGGFRGPNDRSAFKDATPEDVRGYDVRTGRLLWTFHVLPQGGEPGYETWGGDSAGYSGSMGAWASMSADEALGYVYVPLSAPGNSHYGGHRPGDNLYSNSLLAIDVKTGKLAWHYQMVRHDLWDYDNASPPTLGTIRVNGKRINAVIQPNKTGFVFVFDRKTGKPVWPIEDRAVPQSTIPGEYTAPTQPFPTKPPAMDRQNMSEADLIDFTPELNAEARKIASRYVLGDVFSPPTLVENGKLGMMTLPSGRGSANWNTGAFDPETGHYYAVSTMMPGWNGMVKSQQTGPNIIAYVNAKDEDTTESYGPGPQGLPLIKPPYGRITAYDMNAGEIKWAVPNGDGPRDHPAIKHLNLPPLGTIGRPMALVTKSLLFVGESSDAISGRLGVSGASTFRAYDKQTGAVVAQTTLPAGTTGGPITYLSHGKQIIVVPVGGRSGNAAWVALGVQE